MVFHYTLEQFSGIGIHSVCSTKSFTRDINFILIFLTFLYNAIAATSTNKMTLEPRFYDHGLSRYTASYDGILILTNLNEIDLVFTLSQDARIRYCVVQNSDKTVMNP